MSLPVFFSGGTAIGQLARYFAIHDIPAAYLITTFDNGGSSAELRRVFNMPAPGDLRNRLLMLTPRNFSAPTRRFLRQRLSKTLPPEALEKQFRLLLDPDNANWLSMPAHVKNTLRQALSHFDAARPANFNLANASVGNLVLAGFYLMQGRDISAAALRLAAILEILGMVEPITLAQLQLGARLANGAIVIGQEKFKRLNSRIEEIFLTAQEKGDPREMRQCSPPLTERAGKILERASIICYPPGSFFSSVLVNLKCAGAPEAIAANPCPKIFIPNSGNDPETKGMGVLSQARAILKALGGDENAPPRGILDYVLVDSQNGLYGGNLRLDTRILESMGARVLDRPVVCPARPGKHLPKTVADILLEISRENA